MLLSVYGEGYPAASATTIHSMHRLRHAVFRERLDWDVPSCDGLERDEFDDAGPVYLTYHGPEGDVVGSVRLLPTTGPNMIRDVFPFLADEPIPAHPQVWEVSRFCVDVAEAERTDRHGLNTVTYSLVAGIHEVGLENGITHMVAVMDARLERILRRAGCMMRRIGRPQRIGNCIALAVEFQVSPKALAAIRANGGLPSRVIPGRFAEAA